MVNCQALGDKKDHGGRLAAWIIAVHDAFDQSGEDNGVYVRVVLCMRHAEAIRESGHRIREEN